MQNKARKPTSKQYTNYIVSQYKGGEIALAEAFRLLAGGPEPHSPLPEHKAMSKENLLEILSEMNELVGLEQVKAVVKELFALIYMQERRQSAHLRTEPIVLHMVFKGNPGTGKTTVARLLAKMFHECGLLPKGHLVEVERADLVGEYIGHTAQKTREQIKKALGGVLFVDEAYSLARGGEKDFGREAIDCLVKGMEDYRNQFIAIIAGYHLEMDWFLSTNPGLPSRFPIQLTFPDYDTAALLEIARRMAASRQYRITVEAELKLRNQIHHIQSGALGIEHFSNARWVRNTLEQAIRRHALRLFDESKLNRDQLTSLLPDDFRWGRGSV